MGFGMGDGGLDGGWIYAAHPWVWNFEIGTLKLGWMNGWADDGQIQRGYRWKEV